MSAVPEGGLPAAEVDGPPLTSESFDVLRRFIRRETGISLADGKEALVKARLAPRLRALGLTSFRDYCRRVVDRGDLRERVHLFDSIVTGETHFFREHGHFRFLEERAFPEWKERARRGRMSRRIRVWSAGCATGEEPFSLAMFLTDHLPPSAGWSVEVRGTDLSSRALQQAQAAVWPIAKAREIPAPYLQRYMLRGTRGQSGKMMAQGDLRTLVRFEKLNLNDDPYPDLGTFELIFCRNVLIYFGMDAKREVLRRVLRHLSPSGYLFLGNAENVNGLTDQVRSIIPAVYAPLGARGQGAAAGRE